MDDLHHLLHVESQVLARCLLGLQLWKPGANGCHEGMRAPCKRRAFKEAFVLGTVETTDPGAVSAVHDDLG